MVLPLLESDLLTVMQATTFGTLAQTEVRCSDKSACCVINASRGYPLSYEKGFLLTMTPEAAAHTYVAGAKLVDGKLVTSLGPGYRHHCPWQTLWNRPLQRPTVWPGKYNSTTPTAEATSAPERCKRRFPPPRGSMRTARSCTGSMS